MDTDTLVENLIDDGQKLVEELARREFDLAAAFWLKASDDGKWRFFIVSPIVEAEGIANAYRRLHPLVYAIPHPLSISPLEIRLIGSTNPIAHDVLSALHGRLRGPHVSPIRWPGRMLGNVIVDGDISLSRAGNSPVTEELLNDVGRLPTAALSTESGRALRFLMDKPVNIIYFHTWGD